MHKKTQGQSLVEFALTMPFILLLLMGVVDIGRAFYTSVQLQSAISEGSHWGAIFPSCIANADNFTGGTHPECQGSNAIDERILNEEVFLNRNNYLCVKATVTGADPTNPQPGDDLYLQVKFRVTMVTPIMGALFPEGLDIFASTHETIRGTMANLPSIAPIAMADQGGIVPGCAIP